MKSFGKKIDYLKRVKYSLTMDYNRRKKKSQTSGSPKFIFWIVLALSAFLVIKYCNFSKISPSEGGYEAAIQNYGREIKILAQQFDLSKDFLMALIMLESSGKADVPPRFEPAVYQKLKDIQQHKSGSLESIIYSDISDASDDALKNLASSWGPFQLMGYKCLHLNVKIKDLRDSNSLYWGVYWIDKTYGDYVRKERYADAFHIHNTGHPVPKNGKHRTFDKNYVKKGLEYMEYFKNNF
ncbi:MAG: hypothetical protein II956_15335 [Bacteroidales bacterium]|nr:hypothetical protein [Bacteroidales bacterium]